MRRTLAAETVVSRCVNRETLHEPLQTFSGQTIANAIQAHNLDQRAVRCDVTPACGGSQAKFAVHQTDNEARSPPGTAPVIG
jgi:hypothetical protein